MIASKQSGTPPIKQEKVFKFPPDQDRAKSSKKIKARAESLLIASPTQTARMASKDDSCLPEEETERDEVTITKDPVLYSPTFSSLSSPMRSPSPIRSHRSISSEKHEEKAKDARIYQAPVSF
jgi:hypothetical protein